MLLNSLLDLYASCQSASYTNGKHHHRHQQHQKGVFGFVSKKKSSKKRFVFLHPFRVASILCAIMSGVDLSDWGFRVSF